VSSLNIKQIDERLLRRLRELARSKHVSLNTFVRQLLARSVGLEPGVQTYTELHDLAGAWSEEDEKELLDATEPFRGVDESLWR
jgi:hypothetical protein